MEIRRNITPPPFFSICIPQYNRTSFLNLALEVLMQQSFKDFEICISDGGSNDNRQSEVVDYLERAGVAFVYYRQEDNLPYDANLRSSISLASGRYCLLMGNDDCLFDKKTLDTLYHKIKKFEFPDAVITNFEDWETGQKVKRVPRDRIWEGGPRTIVHRFRNLSFISGLLINRVMAQEVATDLWDGSEMYQMYIFAKVVGCGGFMLELGDSYVRKDIKVQGEKVDSYLQIICREDFSEDLNLPMFKIARLIFYSIEPFLSFQNKSKVAREILFQLYAYTYAFWIFEFRRTKSWIFALRFALGCQPRKIANNFPLSFSEKIKVHAFYAIFFLFGLLVPKALFFRFRDQLHKFSKR